MVSPQYDLLLASSCDLLIVKNGTRWGGEVTRLTYRS